MSIHAYYFKAETDRGAFVVEVVLEREDREEALRRAAWALRALGLGPRLVERRYGSAVMDGIIVATDGMLYADEGVWAAVGKQQEFRLRYQAQRRRDGLPQER